MLIILTSEPFITEIFSFLLFSVWGAVRCCMFFVDVVVVASVAHWSSRRTAAARIEPSEQEPSRSSVNY